MIVVVAPGQGAQAPGFLDPWVAEPAFKERLDAYSDAAGLDLAAHGTTSDADTIRATEIAQPLIVAASLLAFSGLTEPIGAVAGHSVGEVTAAVVSGILSPPDGMRLVAARGAAMAKAAAITPTGMAAVVGGDEGEVLARIAELGLEPANRNGASQIVAAGAPDALAQLVAQPPKGARVVPLQVAGAFHTRYMRPAVETLATFVSTLEPADPTTTLWTNHDGSVVTGGRAFLDLLVGQVASPVRWDATMASFADAGISGLIELTPAGTLTGIAKRALRGVPSVAIKTPDDLAAADALLRGAA